MSLLDRSPGDEPVIVYPEEDYYDKDGNHMVRASATGFPAVARFQVQGQSGTSSRRAEQQDEGFESEKVYTVRFPNWFTTQYGELGAATQIEWRGERWSLFGDVNRSNGSPRTRHDWYRVRRA